MRAYMRGKMVVIKKLIHLRRAFASIRGKEMQLVVDFGDKFRVCVHAVGEHGMKEAITSINDDVRRISFGFFHLSATAVVL